MAPRFVSPMIRRRPLASLHTSNTQGGSEHIADNVVQNTPTNTPTDSPNTEEQPEEVSRVAFGTYRQIRDYSLVLLSQGIEHRLEHSEEGPFEIFVHPEYEDRALHQIELYRRENPPKKDNPPMPLSISFQPLWVLLVPSVITVADFGNFFAGLHNRGLSDAYKVLHGEWWRTITALTLHGDTHHLAGNLVSGYIVLNLLAYRIPLARMVPFLAVASALANFCVALTVQSDFRSLGFSTFVFACIGALAVIEFRLMPKETHGMLRRFAPLCGAISIAVFLGLGEHADILGHAYGFLAGMLCGFIPKKKMLRWGTPTTLKDLVWIAAYFAVFAIGWSLALN
jgi:membrane associated rhomboid family serine protease